MKVAYGDSLAYKLEQRINALAYNIILRSDAADLGGERQVTYAFKQLIRQKKLVRIGYGIYAKLEVFSDTGQAYLKEPNGFTGAVREALDRLNVVWLPSQAELDYNSGKSTQIPARYILRLPNRFRRKISYKGRLFQYERVS